MSAGRPLEYNPDQALDAAMQLFWCSGFESASLQHLLRVTGLSKSSFYQAYKSKHQLFLRCLGLYEKELLTDLKAQLQQADSGLAFLRSFYLNVTSDTSGANARRGCLLMNTASEFEQSDPEIADLVANSIGKITSIFEEAIKQAQLEGDVSIDKDSGSLAFFLLSSMSGLKNMVKAGADKKTIRSIAKTTLSVLE